MLERRIGNLLPEQVGQRADDDQEGSDPLADHRGERAVEVVRAPKVGDLERHIESSRGCLELCEADL